MRRLIAAAIVTVGLTLVAAPLFAHDTYRVIGTVTKVEPTKLDVKTKDGSTVSIKMDKQTVFWRDKKKIASAEVKNGLSVVVDGYGDSEEDLLALDVTLIPALSKTAPKK